MYMSFDDVCKMEHIADDSKKVVDDIVRKKCGDCRFWSHESCVKWPGHYIGENANKICEHFEQADSVNHPNHYTHGGIECIECIKAALGENFIGFLIGNVIKYAYRYKDKNGVEDLRKSRWYIDRAIKELSENDER